MHFAGGGAVGSIYAILDHFFRYHCKFLPHFDSIFAILSVSKTYPVASVPPGSVFIVFNFISKRNDLICEDGYTPANFYGMPLQKIGCQFYKKSLQIASWHFWQASIYSVYIPTKQKQRKGRPISKNVNGCWVMRPSINHVDRFLGILIP